MQRGFLAALYLVALLYVAAGCASRPVLRQVDQPLAVNLPDARRTCALGVDRILILGGTESILRSHWGVENGFWATVDASSGAVLKGAEFDGPVIRGMVAAADGRHVLFWGDHALSQDQYARRALYLALWDTTDAREVVRFDAGIDEQPIRAAAMSGDGRRVITIQDNRPLRLWDVRSGVMLRQVETAVNSLSVALDVHGDVAALGGGVNDEAVYLWDLRLNQVIHRMEGHRGPVASVTFAPDGTRLLSASLDGSVRLWDAERGEALRLLPTMEEPVYAVTLSPDGRFALAVAAVVTPPKRAEQPILPGSTAWLWDLASSRLLERISLASPEVITAATFAPGGRAITLSSTNTVHPYRFRPPRGGQLDPAPADALRLPGEGDDPLLALETDKAHGVVFLNDGQMLLMGPENRFTRWDIERGVAIGAAQPVEKQHYRQVQVVSPDGRLAVSLPRSRGYPAILWETGSGLVLRELRVPNSDVQDIAFTPDSRRVMMLLSSHAPGNRSKVRIAVVDITSGAMTGDMELDGYHWTRLGLSPDGSTIILSTTGFRDPVAAIDAQTGRLILGYSGIKGPMRSVSFSADGRCLLVASDDQFAVWDIGNPHPLMSQVVPGGVRSVALSPDGRLVLTGGYDTNVRLWDVGEQRQVTWFGHNRYPVTAVAFTPDGRRAVSASHDQTLRIWQIPDMP